MACNGIWASILLISAFEEFGMMPELIQAMEDMEWYLPRPVQQESIPLILGGLRPRCVVTPLKCFNISKAILDDLRCVFVILFPYRAHTFRVGVPRHLIALKRLSVCVPSAYT